MGVILKSTFLKRTKLWFSWMSNVHFSETFFKLKLNQIGQILLHTKTKSNVNIHENLNLDVLMYFKTFTLYEKFLFSKGFPL